MAHLIAHLSDMHLLAPKPSGIGAHASVRTRVVSIGRPLDATARIERVFRALAGARDAGADHLVVSGDLTETGHPAELEAAAAVLAQSGFAPDRITLVPGNHDRYEAAGSWAAAMEGPLAPYARGSAGKPGKVVDLGNLRLLPIDVTRPQSVALATGVLTQEIADALERRLTDFASGSVPVVVVQHHPPYDRGPVMRWLDGLAGWEKESALFERIENVQVLHGHLHEDADRPMHDKPMRIFGAPAVVEDGSSPRVRLYEVTLDGLLPLRQTHDEAA